MEKAFLVTDIAKICVNLFLICVDLCEDWVRMKKRDE